MDDTTMDDMGMDTAIPASISAMDTLDAKLARIGTLVEQGAAMLLDANSTVEHGKSKSPGRGRPSTVYEITSGGKTVKLNKAEFEEASELAKHKQSIAKPITQQELETLAAMAIPQLMHRAIILAHASTSIKDVLAVTKELSDRAFGKAKQTVDITHSDRDIRKAWDEFDNYVDVAGTYVEMNDEQ